jgi:16S rRNA (cytosine967-C5)-methyltransferase
VKPVDRKNKQTIPLYALKACPGKDPIMAENPKTPRLHRNLVAGVIEALETAFGKDIYVDKVLERLLKQNKKWGSRDRSFVAENTYEIVRHWRFLWTLMERSPSLKPKALYRLFGVWWRYQGHSLPDWPEFEVIRDLNLAQAEQAIAGQLPLQESYPDWLHERAQEELGATWPALAQELNRPAALILRTNTLRSTREALLERLAQEKVEARPLPGNEVGLILSRRVNVFRLDSFREGLYEVQDGGSQAIAPFLEVAPGQRVIDACAGAGGKTLHLAALMQSQGRLLAMDVAEHKLAELKKRARRNRVSNLDLRLIDTTKVTKRLKGQADRLLLDVPCSGTGVIKRNPDTKWKLQPEHLQRTKRMQREILERYPAMLKPGGKAVYATCSVLRSENEDQVAHFLERHPGFVLEAETRVGPAAHSDGFYMARLRRTE